jgi:hypothetical protein
MFVEGISILNLDIKNIFKFNNNLFPADFHYMFISFTYPPDKEETKA